MYRMYRRLLLFIISFSIASSLYAQEEEDYDEINLEEVTVQNVRIDSLVQNTPASKAPVMAPNLENIPQKYSSSEFNYQEEEGTRFYESMIELLFSIFRKIMELIFGGKKNVPSAYEAYSFMGVISLLIVFFFIIRWLIYGKGRWFFDRTKEEITDIDYNEVEKHIHQVNFQDLIQRAEKQNDTRQSIRLHYLWLLKVLSDRGVIEWHIRKTNSDYERELKDSAQKADFVYLSKVYNYIWYGDFSINDIQYQNAKADFQKYINAQKNK